MQRVSRLVAVTLTSAAAAALVASCATTPPTGPMGFFITSANPGNGGNLGGLAGADAHCQKLAAAAGAGSRNWRAHLICQMPRRFASGAKISRVSFAMRLRFSSGM